MSTTPRFPTDEMTLRLLIEACSINEELGRTCLGDFLHMGTVVASQTLIDDEGGIPVYEVEYEEGRAPWSQQSVIIALAEEVLRLRGEEAE